MTYQHAIKVKPSGNIWIDGLTDGYRWGTNSDRPAIGYTFISNTQDAPRGTFGGYPSLGWSQQERQLILDGIHDIESVSGLRFIDRGDDADDQVEIWFYTLDNKNADDSYGFAYTPGSDSDEGLVAINRSMYEFPDGKVKHSIVRGSFYGITFLHELCHAIGLKHPHERGLLGQPRFPGLKRWSNEYRDKGTYNQNAHPFTQLSYVDKGARNGYVPRAIQDHGFLKSLGALDIAALQWLYGVNTDFKIGSNVYRLPTSNKEGTGWRAIWDGGGKDRIDGSRAKSPVTIDLRNATLDQSENAGGHISSVEGVFGGFTIAHDWDGMTPEDPAGLCIIENATGGAADDRLLGNVASNRLCGRKGDDVLYGGIGGRDILIGGRGHDQFWIDTNPGSFAKVKDFRVGVDQLVFEVPKMDLSLERVGRHLVVEYAASPVLKLLGLSSISLKKDLIFGDFSDI
ncbi:M10 family metallopeptidase C-terminal domain-containing protein [Synechococcus sp. RS9902]|uniref:M10 family metallopeptidase C-terminal domain-containing protein n=1 Tax=Synechococcus sp. RS9902 TaxID=221345 RepID=UPI001644DD18|nr:M10 family metallopeptidase C-terminal domain-containing protein [Synechococcus sp. RS9902]QNI98466.1 metallopeptidase [Synechococcus sp. RS9902]